MTAPYSGSPHDRMLLAEMTPTLGKRCYSLFIGIELPITYLSPPPHPLPIGPHAISLVIFHKCRTPSACELPTCVFFVVKTSFFSSYFLFPQIPPCVLSTFFLTYCQVISGKLLLFLLLRCCVDFFFRRTSMPCFRKECFPGLASAGGMTPEYATPFIDIFLPRVVPVSILLVHEPFSKQDERSLFPVGPDISMRFFVLVFLFRAILVTSHFSS